MIVTTNGSRIESIKPLILPNPAAKKQSTSSPETELQGNLQTLKFLNLSLYIPRNAYVHFPEFRATGYGTDMEQMRSYSWKLMTVLLEQIRCFDY